MNRNEFVRSLAIGSAALALSGFTPSVDSMMPQVTRKIYLTGGGFDLTTLNYIIGLTGKPRPKICFLPTPVGDSEAHINRWFAAAKQLPFEPYVQKVFITSTEQTTSFETTLLSVDAILVTGGNTLNAMALWKAHQIDEVLKKAWQKGIVLSGASAGAICWFEQGLSDSRPMQLTKVDGLGLLRGSNCPHYHNEANRRLSYMEMIEKGGMLPGYACDNAAGLYFEDQKLVRVVSQNKTDRAFRVERINGKVIETELSAEII